LKRRGKEVTKIKKGKAENSTREDDRERKKMKMKKKGEEKTKQRHEVWK
jgi:hypothetical protein